MIERHVQTIFCDDIRQEINAKLSYIGVYSGSLYLQSFPSTLSKLCVAVKVVTPADNPLGALTIRILRDEDVLQEITVDEGEINAVSSPPDNVTEEELKSRVQTAQFMIVFSPIKFDEACVLKVRVQTEKEELRGMGLRILQQPPITQN